MIYQSFQIFLIFICALTTAQAHALPDALNSQYSFTDELELSFEQPVCLTSPPAQSSLYVVEKGGRIYVIEDLKKPQKTLFLDISSKIDAKGESGLLGLAFHPNFQNNQTFFIFYSGLEGQLRYQIVSKCILSSPSKKGTSFEETILIKQLDEAGNHNGGDLHFGPDGYLYISTGDEGKGGDHYQNSQKLDQDFFSAILRIDVDMKENNLWPNPHPAVHLSEQGMPHYKVPADNPWIDTREFFGKPIKPKELRTEFWAIGLRNPWRMSFDPEGNLWIGDVGQNVLEEINVIKAGQKGLNFGWAIREGTQAYLETQPDKTEAFTDPFYEYGRQGMLTTYLGRSVTGGVHCRSDLVPELRGRYIFGDYINGNIWSLNSKDPSSVELISNLMNVSAFGIHPVSGEVLACSLSAGKVLTLKKNLQKPKPLPTLLSQTGLFTSLKPLVADSSLTPYRTNVDAWSDYASQKKWFHLPKGKVFNVLTNRSWNAPAGSFWVQHFKLERERGQEQSAFHLETRILVKTHDGVYGLSYRWNDEQTEATLVSEYGDTQTYEIQVDGVSKKQTWGFPSRMECTMCHNNVSGYNLSFNTRQLNHPFIDKGKNTSFIEWMFSNHYLDKRPSKNELKQALAPLDSDAGLNKKARSYLDVNCSACHQHGGTTPIAMDLRSFISFDESKMNRKALLDLGRDKLKIVNPGYPEHSVILNRMSASDGFTRMPFINSKEVDHKAIKVISDWIATLKDLEQSSP